MIKLFKSLKAWQTGDFEQVFKHEVEQLGISVLPLQQGLSQSSYAKDDEFTVMVIKSTEAASNIMVKAGIFYNGMIPGCSCADDPTPDSEYTEYCELLFEINRDSANTSVSLL